MLWVLPSPPHHHPKVADSGYHSQYFTSYALLLLNLHILHLIITRTLKSNLTDSAGFPKSMLHRLLNLFLPRKIRFCHQITLERTKLNMITFVSLLQNFSKPLMCKCVQLNSRGGLCNRYHSLFYSGTLFSQSILKD